MMLFCPVPIADYESCSWGVSPGHFVIVSSAYDLKVRKVNRRRHFTNNLKFFVHFSEIENEIWVKESLAGGTGSFASIWILFIRLRESRWQPPKTVQRLAFVPQPAAQIAVPAARVWTSNSNLHRQIFGGRKKTRKKVPKFRSDRNRLKRPSLRSGTGYRTVFVSLKSDC